MRDALLFIGGSIVVAFSFGFLTASNPSPPSAISGETTPPALVHPGRQLALAAFRFEKLAPEPVVVEPEPEPAPPGPPPVDIAEQFRRDLSAIVSTGAAPVLVMVDREQPSSRRALKRGDGYRDGWKIQDIGPQDVILRRKGETRLVRTAGAYPADASAGELSSEGDPGAQIAQEGAPEGRRLQLSRKNARGGL